MRSRPVTVFIVTAIVCWWCELIRQANGPEVAGQIRMRQVRVRDGEVAVDAPISPPGVARQNAAGSIAISDRQHCMSAQDLLIERGHRHLTGIGDRITLEAFVNGEAEYERV